MSNLAEVLTPEKEKVFMPLAPDYVSHWGVWEAMRELFQNALDSESHKIRYDGDSVSVESRGTPLTREHLLLGNSGKRNDSSSIGQFGEGLKLALLVLTRMDLRVTVMTGNEVWECGFEPHPQLGADCLCVEIETLPCDTGSVNIMVSGMTPEQVKSVRDNEFPTLDEHQVIAEHAGAMCFEAPSEWDGTQKVFVNGLYICDLNENMDYYYSYNFTPSQITLDRDRRTVSDWDMGYQATILLVKAGRTDILAALARDCAADISDSYRNIVDWYGHGSSDEENEEFKASVREAALRDFFEEHGQMAFPINADWPTGKTLLYTEMAEKANRRPVTITPAWFEMVWDECFSSLIGEMPTRSEQLYHQIDDILVEQKKHLRRCTRNALEELRTVALLRNV